jgi:type VI secretion system protein ImpM
MSQETLAEGRIGWYGKLPALGDFLCHELPESFVGGWDAWLREGMALAAGIHGEDWQDNFLRFPVWRFLRRPPGNEEHVWAGLLVPSVDRVGRLFPLTVAFATLADNFATTGLEWLEPCLDAIEDWTLALLADDDMAGFGQAMSEIENRVLLSDATRSADVATPSLLAAVLGRQALIARLAGEALFWTRTDEDAGKMLSLSEPLQAEAFGRLVLPAMQTLVNE